MSQPTFADKLNLFLERYTKPDGSRWTARDIAEATNGFVTDSYFLNLKAGRIRQPGYARLQAIAAAMGFPTALWYEPPEHWGDAESRELGRQPSLQRALALLFETVTNGDTGAPFTAEEVARLSAGQLTERDVSGLRTGEFTDPTMSQILALSRIFGVEPGFWYSSSQDLLALDPSTFDALRDKKNHLILNKIHGRDDAEKDMILRTLEHLDRVRDLYRPASGPDR